MSTKCYNTFTNHDVHREEIVASIVYSYKVISEAAGKEMETIYSRLDAGEVSKAPGLLDKWLREGKMSVEEAFNKSVETFFAGADMVIYRLTHAFIHAYVFQTLLVIP